MTKTELALLAVYKSPTVQLRDICEKYLNLQYGQARDNAAKGTLDIPTFRLRNSQKAPLMVSLQELATYIDRQANEAKYQWEQAQV